MDGVVSIFLFIDEDKKIESSLSRHNLPIEDISNFHGKVRPCCSVSLQSISHSWQLISLTFDELKNP